MANKVLNIDNNTKILVKEQLNYLLGVNTTSYCFVTGYGTISPVSTHAKCYADNAQSYSCNEVTIYGILCLFIYLLVFRQNSEFKKVKHLNIGKKASLF